jgi:hypothetical protein
MAIDVLFVGITLSVALVGVRGLTVSLFAAVGLFASLHGKEFRQVTRWSFGAFQGGRQANPDGQEA